MTLAAVVPQGAAGAAYEKAATTILCDCGCHPQSVKDCACARAEEMRAALATEAASGKPGDAIVAGYVAKYGQKILIAPEASGFNLVAWLLPGFGLVLAAASLGLLIRRWKRGTPAPAAIGPAGPPASAVDAEYRARLARNLEELR